MKNRNTAPLLFGKLQSLCFNIDDFGGRIAPIFEPHSNKQNGRENRTGYNQSHCSGHEDFGQQLWAIGQVSFIKSVWKLTTIWKILLKRHVFFMQELFGSPNVRAKWLERIQPKKLRRQRGSPHSGLWFRWWWLPFQVYEWPFQKSQCYLWPRYAGFRGNAYQMDNNCILI